MAEEDGAAAEELADAGAELFIYPGSTHLFTDASLPDYDAASAALMLERTLRLLARWHREGGIRTIARNQDGALGTNGTVGEVMHHNRWLATLADPRHLAYS